MPVSNQLLNSTVLSGLDVLRRDGHPWLRDRRVGLITNPVGITHDLQNGIDVLYRHPDCRLVALYGPEHGLRGDAQDAIPIETATDPRTGLPVYSLYGPTQKPTPEMLAGVDLLIVDLQDAGVRFYTYLYTMAYAMQAAAEQGIPILVLDRPTPIGGEAVEGPILDPAYASFVGLYPIPIRPGMTISELALLFNAEFGISAELDAVRCQGWRRNLWFDQTGLPWVMPSPNLPTLDSATVYPGTCLIEGTNVSEGRGTTRPFELIGAPWIDPYALADAMNALALPGVRFRPAYFTPVFSKHQGVLCAGVQLHVHDRLALHSVAVAVHLIQAIRQLHPDRFEWRPPWEPGGRWPIDLLSGSDALRKQIEADVPAGEIIASWEPGLREFAARREAYLLYE
jgi:uncharacterized protein YbbC (DUF1343 family)